MIFSIKKQFKITFHAKTKQFLRCKYMNGDRNASSGLIGKGKNQIQFERCFLENFSYYFFFSLWEISRFPWVPLMTNLINSEMMPN